MNRVLFKGGRGGSSPHKGNFAAHDIIAIMGAKDKIVLAYSGGLDTSIIIPWLKEHYNNAAIYGICVNVGQCEDWDAIIAKGKASGAVDVVVRDVRNEFVEEYIFPMLRAGAVYERKYLLGTSIARPLQAKCQVEYARELGAASLAHGCTGKGNDQIRFELAYKALAPDCSIIAPWRMWNIRSREEAIEYAQRHGIPLGDVNKTNIYSRDENVWHTSHEGGLLENPWNRPEESMFLRSKAPSEVVDAEEELCIRFEQSRPVALNNKAMGLFELIETLNAVAGAHGIGRADIVETRLVGMKSRGVYETPAGTVLYEALSELEMITLDKDTLAMKNMLALKYAEEVYAGKWFNHFRKAMDAYMQEASRYVSGEARLVLHKGRVHVVGRKSEYSLYSEDIASFGESSYDHNDATGFINLYGLNTGMQAMVRADKAFKATEQTKLLKEMANFSKK